MIRSVEIRDAENICTIYNEYIQNTVISLEEDILSVDDVSSRIREVTRKYPWLVYEEENSVIGYTYATQWRVRSGYRHSVETAIYVDSNHLSKGVGTVLLKALLSKLRDQSIHSVMAGIALPNPASISLYEKSGFEKVAHFREVGYKFNQWVDVAYWELIL